MQITKEIERIYFKENNGSGFPKSEMVFKNEGDSASIYFGTGYTDLVKFSDALQFIDNGNEIIFTFHPNDLAKRKEIKLEYGDFMTFRQMLLGLEISGKIDFNSNLGEIEYSGTIKIN